MLSWIISNHKEIKSSTWYTRLLKYRKESIRSRKMLILSLLMMNSRPRKWINIGSWKNLQDWHLKNSHKKNKKKNHSMTKRWIFVLPSINRSIPKDNKSLILFQDKSPSKKKSPKTKRFSMILNTRTKINWSESNS